MDWIDDRDPLGPYLAAKEKLFGVVACQKHLREHDGENGPSVSVAPDRRGDVVRAKGG
jgi:hypothetical protein